MIMSSDLEHLKTGRNISSGRVKYPNTSIRHGRFIFFLLLLWGPWSTYGQSQPVIFRKLDASWLDLSNAGQLPGVPAHAGSGNMTQRNELLQPRTPFPDDTIPSIDDLDVVGAEFILTADSPEFFTLAGITRDAYTNEVVKGVKLEVNQMSDTGSKQLVFTGAFYGGDISVVLRRGRIYQVMISRQNYLTREINLLPKDVQSDDIVIEREFILQKKETDEDLALTITEKSIDGVPYSITTATSLRQDADSKAKVLLRLQPGDRVEVLDTTDQWWWKVRFKEKTGYAKALLMQQESE
ncbi:MAG: SH3 domain-containing protein [Saprospiraceae bacterium]|nr:SH3 domain-containing protein [Lewinella sp.]